MSARKAILLVDDSPIVRAIVVHALSASDFSVATVDDPRAIDGALATSRPDLLLVDATYPNITDEQLVEIVGRHAATIPVVLFSDRPDAEVRDLVSRCNARGSVPKDGTSLAERLVPFLG